MTNLDDAIALYHKEDYDGALKLLKKCDDNNHDVLSWRAEIYIRLEKYKQAEKIYLYLQQALGDDFDEFSSLGLCYYELEIPQKAVENLWQALLHNHDDNVAHTNLGRALYDCYMIANRDYALEIAEKWHKKFPKNIDAQHMGCAILGLTPPAQPNSAFVKDVFEDFAESFDKTLADLEYQAPKTIADYIHQSPKAKGDICDLGCGTGLCAKALKKHYIHIDGVDLSPSMLKKAKRRRFYRDLQAMNITDYLLDKHDCYDWIIAGDVFCYIGDLSSIFTACAHALRDKGLLLATIELHDHPQQPYILSPSGRYRHHVGAMGDMITQSGLTLHAQRDIILRSEHSKAVHGTLLIMG